MVLTRGNTAVLMPIPQTDANLKAIELYRATLFLGAPALYRLILENDRLNLYDLSSLKYCWSGGEQQLLAIGRALMAQPRLLLLDEPLLGLSPKMEDVLIQAVQDINRETGITVLIAEQYARPILPIIEYAYVLIRCWTFDVRCSSFSLTLPESIQ